VALNSINLVAAWYFSLYYSRVCERQADECVQDDPMAFAEMAREFEQMAHANPESNNDLFAHHPSPVKRAARFKERLVAL
jgi:Zn-dependent protease with chaperone function